MPSLKAIENASFMQYGRTAMESHLETPDTKSAIAGLSDSGSSVDGNERKQRAYYLTQKGIWVNCAFAYGCLSPVRANRYGDGF